MRISRSCFHASLGVFLAGAASGAIGCSASSPENTIDESRDRASNALTALTLSNDDSSDDDSGAYSFVVATRVSNGGYRVAALNGAPLTCAEGWLSNSCHVASIDLSPTKLGSADGDAILAQVGTDASRTTILFVGKLALTDPSRDLRRAHRDSTLVAYEIWRAPEPRLVHGDWLHVSHGAKQALFVNWWETSSVASLDLTAAPTMTYCHIAKGEYVCEQSHDGVLEDAAAPAGLVIDGWQGRDGVVHVKQYFLKIDVGQAKLPNGYWYCRADQVMCDDGDCVGALPICTANTAHGRGLLTYTRSSEPVVQPWLVSTTQLKATETALTP